MLVIEVDHSTSKVISGRLSKDQYSGLRRELGYLPENFTWIKKTLLQKRIDKRLYKLSDIEKTPEKIKEITEEETDKINEWDGYTSTLKWDRSARNCEFPSGLLGNARRFFNKWSIEYRLVDNRSLAKKGEKKYETSDELEPRDYQSDIIDKASDRQRGVIKVATGGGKTAIAAGIIANLGVAPFIFYVTSKDLLHQAQEELTKFIRYNGSPLEVGMVGDGHKDIKDVTVMTVQTAMRSLGIKYKAFDDEDRKKDTTDIEDMKPYINKLIREARGMICDEVQHWAAETCQSIAGASVSAHYRYGMSATPYRDLNDDILIESCFGSVIEDINASYLIKRGYLIKPNIYMLNVDNIRSTKYSSYTNIYDEAIMHNGLRNTWISNMASRFCQEGRSPLVLVKRVEHGEILNALIPGSSFLHGTIKSKKRKEHIEKMRKKEVGVTVATCIFDEGVDVRPLDTVLLAGSGKSSTRALQRIGRILRPFEGKKDAIAVDFNDNCKYLRDHSAKRLKIYKTEPEFEIKNMSL